ncbi:MAG: MATE family efflux transporter, partial [Rhodospirillales bacterium]|nr:MATE family efflux transporter [Rhodospirillales bacterium]
MTSRPLPRDLPMWRLALPMILSNLTVPLVGMVDTAVVGRISVADIGAVAVGATVFSFLFWTFAFVRMGTTGFAAQAHGAGDSQGLAGAGVRAYAMAIVIGCGMLILSMPIRWLGLLVVGPSEAVGPLADTYIGIRIWSAPATLVNFVAAGWLLGVQRADLVLVLQVFINLLNVALDLLLGVVLGWGLVGVAWATVIAELSGSGISLALTARLAAKRGAPFRLAAVRDLQAFRRIASVNTDIFLRTLIAVCTITSFTAVGARMGELVLAANGILMLLQTFVAYGLDGFAHAAEALVGGAVGRRDRRAFRAAVAATSRWAVLVSGFYVAGYALFGNQIVGLISDLPEVRQMASIYLPWS